MEWHRQCATSQRLETVPGVGIITAIAIAATVPVPSVLKSGRQFAAWLKLFLRQNSSGGKERLGRVSKMGDGYLRRLLVVGATSVTRRAGTKDTRSGAWVRSLLERKPTRLVTVAVANKTARTAWALLVKGESYRTAPAI
ncbi:transposase [Tropicimonas marinistellae]|uniref:transposase n=1 Tax=Tropicimonas marinistellae TaxID=1739787 RepID=UPI000833C30D|nr:transposase [Tropicimonas marinistellae]